MVRVVMVRLSMFLPSELKVALGVFAAQNGVSMTWCVIEAIKEWLSKRGVEIK